MPYRYLEHKADVMIEATGKDFAEALESAAKAMFDVIANVGEGDEVAIKKESDNVEDLVVETLSELLAQSEVEEMPFSRFKVTKLERGQKPRIEGIAYGKRDAPRKSWVKAVTYHELMVKEENGKATIRVLLDV
jgi:SHS2 domain-containing protein